MIHSLSGVALMSAFMVVHLGLHAKSLAGPGAHIDAIVAALGLLRQPPWLLLLAVPVCWHIGYGLWRIIHSRNNVRHYPLPGNWRYTLQRVTAVVALSFIALHLWVLWVPLLIGSLAPEQAHAALIAALSTTSMSIPWLALAYLIGLGACAYHLAVGLANSATRWGLVTGRRGRAISTASSTLLGAAWLLLAANTVLFLATGWSPLGAATPADDATFCPPAAASGRSR